MTADPNSDQAGLPPGWLRRFTTAVIESPERPWPVRYVVTADGAQLVFPAAPTAVEAGSFTLLIPDDARSSDRAELLVHAEAVADWRLDADADRWQAYFGRPSGSAWVRAVIDSGKLGGVLHEAEAWASVNTLARDEPRLMRLANADRAALGRAAERALGVALHEPLMVGADPWGLHVRHAGGVARAAWPERKEPGTGAEAEALLRQWLG